MAEWIAIIVEALAFVGGMWWRSMKEAEHRGKQDEQMRFMASELNALKLQQQSPGEREALAEVVETRLKSHEEKDDLRFEALSKQMDTKLDAIIRLLTKRLE